MQSPLNMVLKVVAFFYKYFAYFFRYFMYCIFSLLNNLEWWGPCLQTSPKNICSVVTDTFDIHNFQCLLLQSYSRYFRISIRPFICALFHYIINPKTALAIKRYKYDTNFTLKNAHALLHVTIKFNHRQDRNLLTRHFKVERIFTENSWGWFYYKSFGIAHDITF